MGRPDPFIAHSMPNLVDLDFRIFCNFLKGRKLGIFNHSRPLSSYKAVKASIILGKLTLKVSSNLSIRIPSLHTCTNQRIDIVISIRSPMLDPLDPNTTSYPLFYYVLSIISLVNSNNTAI